MVPFLRYLQLGVFLAGLASAGLAYVMWKENRDLKTENRNLIDARQRDAVAAKQYIEQLNREQQALQSRLDALRSVTDEEGQDYLRTRVPDSVRRVFD